METIINYLDNMFAAFPRTSQMLKLKEELLATMEEKYFELKREGKSENEAVGIVISEFGNIEELMREVGIAPEPEHAFGPVLSMSETEQYLAHKKRVGFLIGLGVLLCLTGISSFLALSRLLGDGGSMVGLITMFLFIAVAAGLFIFSGMQGEAFKYLQSDFVLPGDLRAALLKQRQAFMPTYTFAIIVGVGLCVLSPALLFATKLASEELASYGVSGMLLMIGAAVFLFVYAGNVKESFSVLLKEGEYTKESQEQNKVIGAVASVVWPLAAVVFLLGGFLFHAWHIAWIVFPVTALLFGAFSAVYSITKGNAGKSA